MIPIIGRLYRNNVVTYCFGRALHNQSPLQIMKTHRYVRQIAKNELSEFESYPILEAMSQLDLGPSHVDVGKLATKYMESENGITPLEFIRQECGEVIGRHVRPVEQPQDVVLYGFGRIGRLVARLLIEKTGGGDQLRLRAIVVRKGSDDDIVKRASLLRRDSVHGGFQGTIRVDEENSCIIANGNVIHLIHADDRSQIDYEQYGIKDALIIDNTGAWRDEAGLSSSTSKSKGAGRKVILTGARQRTGSRTSSRASTPTSSQPERSQVMGAASCTTNAIVPDA